MFVDTHCHIHESGFYTDDREEVYVRAIAADVKMICIGTTEQFSAEAIEFARTHENVWATVGVHPHDTKDGWGRVRELLEQYASKQSQLRPDNLLENSQQSAELGIPQTSSMGLEFSNKSSGQSPNASDAYCSRGTSVIVGVGEIGLDYFYNNSPRATQIKALEEQLQWAVEYSLPVSFHVREAYGDFWPILANFPGLHGVLHSFTDTVENLEKALSNGLFIGINGISTFARDKQAMFDAVPLEKMLLETDAPFLTPVPYRGKVNEPAFVRNVAEYHASRRKVELEHLARVTSANASSLFGI